MRLSTQRITVLGSLAMVTALIVGACGGGDPTPTPGPRPTATSAPAAPTATSAPAGPTATTAPVAPTATTAPSQPRPTPTLVPIAPPTPTATPEGVQIRRGGVLNVRLLVAFEPWDTYNRRSQFSTEFTLNFWSNLMALITERPSEVEPDLVERWEVTADGKTITLHLTPGAEWHDGQPFTADDVLFNLDRAKNPSGALTAVNQGRMRRLQTFEALDDSTVRLTLDTVSASFLVSLAAPFMLMYPSHLAAEEGDIGVKNPIGTGPFKVTDYKTNQSITVVANENYHRKDELGRTLPFLDGIEFAFIRDRTLARAAFRTGEIHCGCGYDFVTPVGEELQQQVPSAKIVTFSRDAFHMFFNNIPPWNNFRVRQAIQLMFDFPTVHLLDRGGLSLYPPSTLLNLEIGGQFGLPADEILKLPGYRGVTAADREEGLRMLADAGVDPSKTTVRVNGTASFENLTVAAADQFSIMGFKVELMVIPTGGQLTELLRTGDFDIGFQFGGRTVDDPADQIIDYVTTGGVTNYGGWSFPSVDQVADEQDRILDVAERREVLQQWQRRLFELTYFLPIVNSISTWPLQQEVEGFRLGRFAVHTGLRLDTVWLNE